MRKKKVINAQRAIELLREVVAEKGEDFKYSNPDWKVGGHQRCFNFHGDEPGCIVGHVLHKLGVTAEMAQKCGIAEGSSAYDSLWAMVSDPEFGWTFTSQGVAVLTEAQAHQDNRHPWGNALDVAEKYFADVPHGL